MKSTDTSDYLFYGERLKSDSAWDHTVNMKFNVFYSTFTNLFLFLSRFYIYARTNDMQTPIPTAYCAFSILFFIDKLVYR